jgi:hypothetical protein
MPLFKCANCGCMENTALSNYWTRFLQKTAEGELPPALCSACDPRIGRWHGEFPQVPWDDQQHGPHDIQRMVR